MEPLEVFLQGKIGSVTLKGHLGVVYLDAPYKGTSEVAVYGETQGRDQILVDGRLQIGMKVIVTKMKIDRGGLFALEICATDRRN